MRVLKMLPVAMFVAAGWSCAQAADHFITLQRAQTFLGDTTPLKVFNFTLPSGVNRSASVANSAIVDLEVQGVEFAFNEVYINPASTVTCSDNDNDGTNQPSSLGFLRPHLDINMKSEWSTNHIAFSSALLLDNAQNKLMICARNSTGDSSAGNLDNFAVKSMVVHYHTTD